MLKRALFVTATAATLTGSGFCGAIASATTDADVQPNSPSVADPVSGFMNSINSIALTAIATSTGGLPCLSGPPVCD